MYIDIERESICTIRGGGGRSSESMSTIEKGTHSSRTLCMEKSGRERKSLCEGHTHTNIHIDRDVIVEYGNDWVREKATEKRRLRDERIMCDPTLIGCVAIFEGERECVCR